jgi:NitT/TauT family transport system substrate-binding protein
VLITTGKLIRERPELVRRFVHATRLGWQNYLSDPARGNAAILDANEHGMTAEALKFGSEGLRSLAIPEGFTVDQVGSMSEERWNTLVDQMDELKLVDADKVKATDCYTTQFLE